MGEMNNITQNSSERTHDFLYRLWSNHIVPKLEKNLEDIKIDSIIQELKKEWKGKGDEWNEQEVREVIQKYLTSLEPNDKYIKERMDAYKSTVIGNI